MSASPPPSPDPARRFAGRVAFVSGAASGIGRACAERLGLEGATLLCADLAEDGAEATAAAVRASGSEARALRLDVTDADACRAAIDACVGDHGRLDVLGNVAGVAVYANTESMAVADWRRVLDVNLSGTFYLCQAALPHLRESRGSVVNVASTAGLQGIAYAAAYCASKGGVVQLTRALAVEYARRKVRVNCVCPGAVDTPMARSFVPPEGADQRLLARMTPLMPRMARPAEVAGAMAWLASDEARFVTGAALTLDGGQVA